jgi:hypothetical protein
MGHMLELIHKDCGVVEGEWVKEYGPVVRMFGFLGNERLLFLKPEALHKILVSDWLEYPRVLTLTSFQRS